MSDIIEPSEFAGTLIGDLIRARLAETGLKKSELIRRWGYKNIGKGLRRLEQLGAGYFKPTTEQLENLAQALDLPPENVFAAFEATQERLRRIEFDNRKREWDAWSRSFKPHAILTTENSIPEPIFIVALVGAETLLRIDFDYEAPSDKWITHILEKIPFGVMCFGRTTGFILNYSPDHAIRYDLDGKVLGHLPQAKRPGRATFRYT